MVEEARGKSPREHRSYKKIKEQQAAAVNELKQLGILTPRIQAYLAFREVFPKKGVANYQKTELRTVEELLVYDSGVIFNFSDSVFGFSNWRYHAITPERMLRWISEYPQQAESLKSGITETERQTRMLVKSIKEDIHSRALMHQVIDRLESSISK